MQMLGIHSIALPNYLCRDVFLYCQLIQVIKNFIINSVANGVSGLIGIGGGVLIAKILGATDFGIFVLITSSIMFFSAFSASAYGQVFTKIISENIDQKVNAKFNRHIFSLKRNANFAAIFFSFAQVLAVVLLQNTIVLSTLLISISLLTTYLAGKNMINLGVLAGFGAFSSCAALNLFRAGSIAILSIVGAYIYDSEGAVLGFFMAYVFVALLGRKLEQNFLVTDKSEDLKSERFKESNVFLSLSFPSLMYSFVISASNYVLMLLLFRSIGGPAEVGLFNAVNYFFIVLTFLPTAVLQVVFTRIATVKSDGDRVKLLFFYIKAQVGIFLLTLVPMFFLQFYSHQLVSFLGNSYIVGPEILIPTLLCSFFYNSANVSWQFLVSYGKIWAAVGLSLVAAIIQFMYFNYFVSESAVALAESRVLAYIVYALLAIFITINIIKNTPLKRTLHA